MTQQTSALQRSQDRKVSNSVLPSGGARIANSFGLPAGRAYSCPGATAYCERICYAGRIERGHNKAVFPMLKRNLDALTSARSISAKLALLDPMIDEFERECEKWDAPKVFRIHWDGDFFTPSYVTAWQLCIRKHPDVRFWTYTRVASAARMLKRADLPNLGLYFSGDPDNRKVALQLQREGIRVAFVADTFADARASMPEKAVACPELMGRIPLSGACVACGACLRGLSNIAFSTSKR